MEVEVRRVVEVEVLSRGMVLDNVTVLAEDNALRVMIELKPYEEAAVLDGVLLTDTMVLDERNVLAADDAVAIKVELDP